LFLLACSEKAIEPELALQLAIAAGDGLLSEAETVGSATGRQGLRWKMQFGGDRELPNYSHGTAGVCDFLLRLHGACRDPDHKPIVGEYDDRFFTAAEQGCRYLNELSRSGAEQPWIPHHLPGGETLYYWGWCHGPAGTCQLFRGMQRSVAEPQWKILADASLDRLLAAQPSRERGEGYWDNAGLCCGSAGVGAYLLSEFAASGDKRCLDEARRIADDLTQRANRDRNAAGQSLMAWSSAEHRVRPDFRQTQTGLMQGAAGIGLFFLQLDAVEQGGQALDIFEGLFH
jgi:lantibiotic modifying enzyme